MPVRRVYGTVYVCGRLHRFLNLLGDRIIRRSPLVPTSS
nr:MAG TPA: hypothetical protein [Caudoviricetes sp.]